MATLQLRGLLAIDAEKAVARVWYLVEQSGIVSPRIEVCENAGDRININIAFAAQRDADITLRALEGSWSVVAMASAGAQKAS